MASRLLRVPLYAALIKELKFTPLCHSYRMNVLTRQQVPLSPNVEVFATGAIFVPRFFYLVPSSTVQRHLTPFLLDNRHAEN